MTSPLLGRPGRILAAAALVAALSAVGPAPAIAAAPRSSTWIVGFGSIGPVDTRMTVRRAAAVLRSHPATSNAPGSPYCGLFGLSARSAQGRAGLWGYAPRAGGRISMLSAGALFGGSTAGLPAHVRTAAGVALGSSLARLKAAYPGRLTPVRVYSDTVELLPGPKSIDIGFTVRGGRVVNIATGGTADLTASEFCG